MKKLSIPFAIIVALIVSCVGCKELDRHDNDPATPSESPSTDMNSSVSVPETNPVTEVRSLKPIAVPVVTAEEAEKRNEMAKDYAAAEKEKTEPFYKLYADSAYTALNIEGIVKYVSSIPDPQANDYPDCLYSLFIEVNSFESAGSQNQEEALCENEIIVNVPIMKDFSLIDQNVFLPDDRILCVCTAYDEMPQEIRELQLSDSIQSFEHQQYYVLTIKKITGFSHKKSTSFSKREKTLFPIQCLPEDAQAKEKRNERIQQEITRIETELKSHGGSFDAWEKEYAPVAEKYKQLCAQKYSEWIHDSYFAAGGRGGTETKYDTKAFIEGILPYKKYLEENNIDLIVVRIPSRGDFAARVLASDSDRFQENPAWIKHYYECLKNDIEIVDSMPEMWKRKFDYPLFYFYQNENESHPHEGTIMSAAYVVSSVLGRYGAERKDGLLSLKETLFHSDESKSYNFQYMYPPGNEHIDTANKFMSFHQVIENETGRVLRLRDNTSSPFIFVSNSFFGERNMRDYGASIPHYAAYCLQTIPAWNFQSDMHLSMLRNILAQQGKLDRRKALIMVGHPDDWKGGFPSIPKYLLDNARHLSLEKELTFSSSDIVFSAKSDSISLKKTEDGFGEVFTLSDHNTFTFELEIPSLESKSNCMVRFIFDSLNHFTSMSAYYPETPDNIIDELQLSIKSTTADFYIPVKENESNTVKVQFNIGTSMPTQPKKILTINRIELWYY